MEFIIPPADRVLERPRICPLPSSRFVGASGQTSSAPQKAALGLHDMAKLLGSRADAIHDVRDVDAAAGHALDNRDAPGAKRATKRKARSSRVGKHAALNLRPSRFVGVSHKTLKTWRAKIRVDGKLTCLGSFADEIEAARAYDAHVITKKLDRAVNFPEAGGHRPQAKAWSDGEGEEGDEGEWTDHACVDRSAAHSYSTRSRSRVRVRQVESQPSPPRT